MTLALFGKLVVMLLIGLGTICLIRRAGRRR